MLATDGQGVSVLQALAGTGKTRVLGALADRYRQAGFRVVGIQPTGRAARELGEAIDSAAFTSRALVADLERSADFAIGTVVLFDEAGMAPTRQSAVLFAYAERACGWLAEDPVAIAGREFCVSEHVIARRSDRFRDVDNGTCATVRAIDKLTGMLTVEPDGGGRRELDAAYVADHLERAYALMGHGTQGATVEWAGIVGRPSRLTAQWAYTALSRAREQTRLHVIAEPSASADPRLFSLWAPLAWSS